MNQRPMSIQNGSDRLKASSLTVRYPHSQTYQAVLAELDVDTNHGLDPNEAAERLRRFGPNSLADSAGRSALQIFLSQFSSIVVWLLMIAAVVAYFADSALEAAAITVVLILNAGIGFAIEWQARKSLEALNRATVTTVRVRRGGQENLIDSVDLVPGDIVVLTSGDRVPADARLIEAVNIRADESTLTGESLPVDKSLAPVDRDTPLAERSSMLYLGSNVAAGRAVGVITATGPSTELGSVGKMLEQTADTETPLERRLADLGRRLVYLVLAVGVIVMIAGVVRGNDWWLMTKVAISLAVAAVPEGLPAVTTLILALGLLRLARRSAIVRNLSAVEALGSTTVICTDKTGTLTENRMTVTEIVLAGGRTVPFLPDAESAALESPDPQLDRILLVATLCNEGTVNIYDGKIVGEPTEAALLRAAVECGLDVALTYSEFEKVIEVPFDAAAKRMTTVVEEIDGSRTAMLKGAPAVVLEASKEWIDDRGSTVQLESQTRERFIKANEQMARRGLRVLAFADKSLKNDLEGFDSGYTFLGFVGMADPPRAGALEAVREAKSAGIRVVMLTGDQKLTAEAIALQLHLSEDHDIIALHSRDLIDTDSSRLSELAKQAHVFARVTPEDKLKIVKALQSTGDIVAVTGDGINDAPALKQADIGVAFGKRGTDVAKDAADVVLTNDDFSTIVAAIEGGRTIYANIIKFVRLLFSDNLAEIIVIFGAIVAGLPLPVLPLQILWINLVTDVFPALALAVEPASAGTMRRRPRPAAESLLSGRFMFLILWQGAALAAIALSAYLWALRTYGEGVHARTIALLALVSVQLGDLFNCRSLTRSAFDRFFSNPYVFAAVAVVVLLQAAAVYFRPLATVLGLTEPNIDDWGVIAVAFVLPIAIIEVSKFFSRRRGPSGG